MSDKTLVQGPGVDPQHKKKEKGKGEKEEEEEEVKKKLFERN